MKTKAVKTKSKVEKDTKYYYWCSNWRLQTVDWMANGGTPAAGTGYMEYFLENSLGGKIILDKPVYNVLEFLATADIHADISYADIDRCKMVSSTLLEIILKVFIRVGVLSFIKEEWKGIHSVQINLLFKKPLISVIIINYNGVKHLPLLMASLKQQTYSNFDLIIVDNKSRDKSREMLSNQYPRARVLELGRNIGFAAAVNRGIRATKGELILVLNNDIELDCNALHYLAERANELSKDHQTRRWAAIVPKMMFFNNRAFINALGNSLYPLTWGSDNFIGHVDFGQFDNLKQSMSACFGAVLLNRAAVTDIRLLDPHYKFYYEDMDWSFRAYLAGYTIETVPHSIFYHKFGASMNSKSQAFKLRFIVGNRLYFCLKNLESETLRRFLPTYIAEDIKSTLIYLKRGNFSLVGAYILGYARLFLSLPGLMFKRYRLQRERELEQYTDVEILARVTPLNTTTMEQGWPILDVSSLRTNYGFLGPGNDGTSPAPPEDLICWHLRPPRKDKRSQEKIYMEFTFTLPETGNYDIHLLGLIRRKADHTLLLDGAIINPPEPIDKKNKRLIMNFLVGENICIPQGRHFLELGWHSQVYAVLLRKRNAPGGQGDPTNLSEGD